MSKNNRWLAIVNLLSGSGRCGRDWHNIAQKLYAKGIDFDTVFTGYRYHAIELAKRGIVEDGYRNLIAVGGDGTIHEVANGILEQSEVPSTDVRLGVIAVGTGNDWIRTHAIPSDYEEAAEVLARGNTHIQDVAKATFIGRKGTEESRYCVNVGGTGLDAAVNYKVCQMKDKGRNGKSSYMWGLASTILGYRSCQMAAEVDGKRLAEGIIMSMSVGICRYNGSGMLQLPRSKDDDGLLDGTVIDRMSIPKIISVAGKLYNGKIYSERRTHHMQGRSITLTAEKPLEVEIDGEALGTTPVRFDIEPLRLCILVP